MKRSHAVLVAVGVCFGLVSSATTFAGKHKAKAEKPAPHKSPAYLCPLYPIQAWGDDYLYFCDAFDPDCDAEPEADQLIDNRPWPYTDCNATECLASRPKGKDPFRLPKKVDANYMHREHLPTDAGKEFLTVNEHRNRHYLRIKEGRYAKVIEFRVYQRPWVGPGQWKSRFVAFETEVAPTGDVSGLVDPAEKLEGGDYVWRGKIDIAFGCRASVLILLRDPL